MDNSINFKGAIILKQPPKSVERRFISTLGNNRLIFNNFTPKGDTLYITAKKDDKRIAEFLKRNIVDFEFFTDLGLESGFKNKLYKEAKAIIDECNSRVLTTTNELVKFFKLKELKHSLSIKRKDNPLENSLRALGLDKGHQIIVPRNGYSEVLNSDGELLARISGSGQDGISYASVKQQGEKDTPLRFAIRDGEKIFQYTSEYGRTQFIKNYNKAVKANRTASKPNIIHT